MKLFVAFLFLIASVYANIANNEVLTTWKVKFGDELKTIRGNCLEKNTLPLKQFKNIKENYVYDNVPEVRNYLLCIATEMGIFEKGVFKEDRIIEQYRMQLDKTKVQPIVSDCIQKSTNPNEAIDTTETFEALEKNGERVYGFYLCLLDKKTLIGETIIAAANKLKEDAKKLEEDAKKPKEVAKNAEEVPKIAEESNLSSQILN